MKYYANFNVNNGTRLHNPLCDTNLKRITKEIKEYACGQIFCDPTNVGSFWVENEKGEEVTRGNVFISKNLRPYTRTIK